MYDEKAISHIILVPDFLKSQHWYGETRMTYQGFKLGFFCGYEHWLLFKWNWKLLIKTENLSLSKILSQILFTSVVHPARSNHLLTWRPERSGHGEARSQPTSIQTWHRHSWRVRQILWHGGAWWIPRQVTMGKTGTLLKIAIFQISYYRILHIFLTGFYKKNSKNK